MTQDPEQVARLQKQLADAEAQIADVKAQLGEATGQSQSPSEEWREALSPYLSTYADTPPAHQQVAPLAAPPRHVPFTFRIAAFAWSWYEGFGTFMVVIAPIALWGFFPFLVPAGFIV